MSAITRRELIAGAVVGRLSGPEWRRYPDPATEWQVLRLTDPAFSSGMTAPHLRPFTRRSDLLLYSSDRSGSPQAFILNLKDGSSEQLTDAAALDGSALALTPDDREFLFFDGPVLYQSSLNGIHAPREIHRIPEGAVRTGFTLATDGSAVFAERKDGKTRILSVLRQQARRPVEVEDTAEELMARPRHAQILYRAGGALWMVNADGSGKQKLKTEPGVTGEALWTFSGRTLVYLHTPEDPRALITLREYSPDEGVDKLLAKTSQFISASPNADASVFTGASRSTASAYVLILLRAARRELTLCEHHASDPRMVNPVFSPDSKRVFFVSDRHGKPAIYMVAVDKFVEETTAP